MTGKTTFIALSAAIAIGIAGASVAQASDNNSGDYHGGFKVGPFGQVMGSSRGTAFGFAYAPRSHRYYEQRRMWRYER
jgi:hypothetical protein